MTKVAQTPRAKTMTYRARVADVEYGVTRSVTTHHITLTRHLDGSKSAIVDGENVAFGYAVSLLDLSKAQKHTPELLEEVILTPPTIGKAKARALHIELGKLGYRNADHYVLASDMTGRVMASLADLTEEEVILTRSYAYGQLGLMVGVA